MKGNLESKPFCRKVFWYCLLAKAYFLFIYYFIACDIVSIQPGIEPGSPALQADSLPTELPGKPKYVGSK